METGPLSNQIAFIGDYVPNVVYACGALFHGRELVIPYAMSAETTLVSAVSFNDLLQALPPPP
jgi:predicted GH43/DUF377 family glycosyl hydrolase